MRLRCKSKGKDYPAEVSCDITKVLELDIIKWELRGLDTVVEPSHFTLGVKGRYGILIEEECGVGSKRSNGDENKNKFCSTFYDFFGL